MLEGFDVRAFADGLRVVADRSGNRVTDLKINIINYCYRIIFQFYYEYWLGRDGNIMHLWNFRGIFVQKCARKGGAYNRITYQQQNSIAGKSANNQVNLN